MLPPSRRADGSEHNSINYDEIPPFHEIFRSILSDAVP
jgi:hypothetical protein